ncbi:MAG: putative lipid II flippase FtsW [Bacillota bacterium]|nr:putative lipid II flippase FtsW [Bacillota bacterium]
MAKQKRYRMKPGDFVLTILVMALVVFGVIMVFSASYYAAISEYGDAYYYLKRDVMWALLGAVAMVVTSVVNYRIYAKVAPVLLVVSVVLLALLFTPLGDERGGAVRWLDLGIPVTIMPGEIAKICAIIFTAWYLSRDPKIIRSFTRGVLPMLCLCAVYGGLIIAQPNLSTAITVCTIIVGIMFVAGLNLLYLAGLGLAGAAAVTALILSDPEGYWARRLTSFRDPFLDAQGDGWQVIQSFYALGSGGLFGVGLGKSIQKTLYLPEPQNDFILAIIGEELGYVGCILLLICYLVLIWRGCHIAMNAPDAFGTLLASGITIMLAVQVLLNVAVVTSSMPPTGITLPFVSFGGNALLLFMGSMGILLNISRHSAR